MKPKPLQGVLSERLAGKRRGEIMMLRSVRHDKLEKHVMPTYVVDTKRNPHPSPGAPDGGVRSALLGAGGVCQKCGQTRDDILETVEGKTCDAAAYRKFSLPLDFDSTAEPRKERLLGLVTKTVLHMAQLVVTPDNDPLAGIF